MEVIMDEYSPRSYDILVLKYLCDALYREAMLTLHRTKTHWKNDLGSDQSVKLNVLIDHITDFIGQFKLKFPNNVNLFIFIDEYLDETYNLFGKPVMSLTDISDWQKMNEHLAEILTNDIKYSLSNT